MTSHPKPEVPLPIEIICKNPQGSKSPNEANKSIKPIKTVQENLHLRNPSLTTHIQNYSDVRKMVKIVFRREKMSQKRAEGA